MPGVRSLDGLAEADPVPASEDASFRRYFRVHGQSSFVVMDAPPPQEDCRPFIQIAGFLQQTGLNAVEVVEAQVDRGFLLLSDLGSTQYLQAINADPTCAPALYRQALQALLRLQEDSVFCHDQLPHYAAAKMREEMEIFVDWLCGHHLQVQFSNAERRAWEATGDRLVSCALAQPQTFVHRDYHSRNLMVMPTDNPGILDFQDAVVGPMTYDLVSLLKDCYVKWPRDQVLEYVTYFHSRSSLANTMDVEQFLRKMDLMGVQRHLKASGIFARLLHRDGKSGYIHDVPRTLSYITDIAEQYAELEFLGEFLAQRIVPALAGAAR